MKTNNWSSWIINSLLLFFFTFALYIIDDDRWYEWHVGKYGLKKIKMKSRNNVNLCMLLLFASWFLENNKQKISLFHINILSQKKRETYECTHTNNIDLTYFTREFCYSDKERERVNARRGGKSDKNCIQFCWLCQMNICCFCVVYISPDITVVQSLTFN